MQMFSNAIVKQPGRAYIGALTSVELGEVDFELALRQHAAYVRALQQCGLEVTVLPSDDLPDSVFVEDTAICMPGRAILTRPGAESRRAEVESIAAIFSEHFRKVHSIIAPATIDGGDVLETERGMYIGASARTNREGILQCGHVFQQCHRTCTPVEFPEFLHLKSGVSYLGNNVLLVTPSFRDLPEFRAFKKIVTLPEEQYSANAIAVNGRVLVAAGFPDTRNKLEAAGFDCVVLEMSEFEKKDGGLSCLSLRF